MLGSKVQTIVEHNDDQPIARSYGLVGLGVRTEEQLRKLFHPSSIGAMT